MRLRDLLVRKVTGTDDAMVVPSRLLYVFTRTFLALKQGISELSVI